MQNTGNNELEFTNTNRTAKIQSRIPNDTAAEYCFTFGIQYPIHNFQYKDFQL